eukprot:SAG11_NODE_1443_length_4894_cov_20.162044_4_plen_221_part_00
MTTPWRRERESARSRDGPYSRASERKPFGPIDVRSSTTGGVGARSQQLLAQKEVGSPPPTHDGPSSTNVGHLYDQMDELENVVLEERSARLAMAEQLNRLTDDFKRQQNSVAGDMDGVSQAVRGLAVSVEEATKAAKLDRGEVEHAKEEIRDIKDGFHQLEAELLAQLVQEVEDHRDGLHACMDLLDDTASKADLSGIANDVTSQLREGMERYVRNRTKI